VAQRRPPSKSTARARTEAFLAIFLPLLLAGLAIADFANDGQIDKYLIGALMVFGLAAAGYRVDTLMEKYLDAKAAAVRVLEEDDEEK
jgi:hypothetical protein